MKLKDNKILITGATSGIGLAILKRFYDLGNRIVAVGRNHQKLEKLRNDFPQIETIQAELGNQQSVENLIKEIFRLHQDTNILINNAGIQFKYNFGDNDSDFEKIEEEIRVNFISPLQLCFRLISILQKHTESAIINVSSGLALVPKKSASVYCGTKGGLHIFTKSLRYQLENTGIKLFEIIPPTVDTPMHNGEGTDRISPEQLTDEFISAFERDKLEINVGKVKLLRLVQRISPKTADGILKNR